MGKRIAKARARGPRAKPPEVSQAKSSHAGNAEPPPSRSQAPVAHDNRERATTAGLNRNPAPLTRRNLALLNQMIAAERARGTPPSTSELDTLTTPRWTQTTTPSIVNKLAAKTAANNILPARHSRAPKNLKYIRAVLAKSRGSPPPSESEYLAYNSAFQRIRNKRSMLVLTSKLLKDHRDNVYDTVFGCAFTAFHKNLGFNNGLPTLRPDLIEGLQATEFTQVPVHLVYGATLYDSFSVALPHLAGEWKAPGGSMKHAALQCAYVGAALVFGRTGALDYIGQTDPAGQATVMTFATNGASLDVYAHYAAPRPVDEATYHQYLVAHGDLVSSHDAYTGGRQMLRNIQEHARNQSYALRDRLNERWKGPRPGRGTAMRPTPATESSRRGRKAVRHGIVKDASVPRPARATASSRRGRKGRPSARPAKPLAHAIGEPLDGGGDDGGKKRKRQKVVPAPGQCRRSARLQAQGKSS
ncbi:hypothetical protein SPI_03521 [Niveomyces insectorum RCEF 264]|uniref:Uncharacterized protein n=1 Tax=Niveomyces insectorum RCEF 264 TaxID=1081102 RepID=A0A167W5C5_9HYPO|nr:hypothetical protein SPI_03521 [Niveomyces insectorum RCEF 264]